MSRVVLTGNVGSADGWIEKLEGGGYVETETPNVQETRLVHEGGSCARIFRADDADRCYIYPPGGTDRPSGAMHLPAAFKKMMGGT